MSATQKSKTTRSAVKRTNGRRPAAKRAVSRKRPGVNVVSADEARIRERAYCIYLERGGQPGFETEDWLQAERELNGSR